MTSITPQRNDRQPTLERIVFAGTAADRQVSPLLFSPRTAPAAAAVVATEVVFSEPAQVRRDRSDFIDNRPEVAKDLHEAGEYNIPKASRRGMIADLASRPLHKEDGLLFPGWNVRMDFAWNKTGHVEDGLDISSEGDAQWAEALKTDPTIFHRACENALKPWVSAYVDVLEMDGRMLCDIHLKDLGRDTLLLKAFNEKPLGFARRDDWRGALETLSDTEVGDLWTAFKVLDSDLSQNHRAEIMACEYNAIRHEMEEDWVVEIEHLSF